MGTIPAPNIVEDAQQIANAPMNAMAEYARVAQLHQQTASLAQEQQERALEMEAQRRQLNDQDALTKTISQYDPTKHTIADIPKMVTANGGSGQAALQAQQGLITQKRNLMQMSDEQFAEEQKRADLIQGMHDQVSQAPPEQKQDLYSSGLQRLAAAGVNVSNEPMQYPGDAVFAQHLPAIRLHSAIIADAEKDREATAKEITAQAEQTKAETGEWEKFPELGVMVNTKTGEQRNVAGAAGVMAPGMMEAKYVALQQKKNTGQPLSADDAAFVKGYEKFKTLVPQFQVNMQNATGAGSPAAQVAQRFGMTPEAFDQAAERWGSMGQLPPIGRGGQGQALNKAIMNRYAELHPGASLAEGSAEYNANKASLAKLQSNFDQVSSFETTAQKNLDLFIEKLGKIPDLGVKFANVPLRMIDAKMIGSDNYSAMKAAQQTAASETAKVLASANASGVLSDTQKKEAEDMLSGNMTLSAAKNVVATLKQDFANRHQSYQDQIADIKGRMGGKQNTQAQGGSNEQPSSAGPVARPANATHTGVGSIDKKKHWLDAQGRDLGVAE